MKYPEKDYEECDISDSYYDIINTCLAVYRTTESVLEERYRQNLKFTNNKDGVQRHNLLTWACILAEESGEVVQAALQAVFDKQDLAHVREELVQTAAVAFAIIERIDDLDDFLFAPEGTYNG